MRSDLSGKPFARAGLLFAACVWLAGCAGPAGLFASETKAPPFRDPAMTVQGALDAIAVGQSRKADVLAALGPASVVTFDSGFEVWVYGTRTTSDIAKSQAELVILFTPLGVVQKTRMRPAYQ